jgi:uncharacterized membrane protein
MDQFVQQIINLFGGAPPEVIIFIVSLIPALELRGGMLAAGLLGVDMGKAFFICLAGTLLPVPFILLFFRKIMGRLKNTRFVKVVRKAEKKLSEKSKEIEKYKTFGLLVFVAVPLPGTGAWTGSMVAALMSMRFRHALFSVAAGSAVADLIMCLVSYGILGQVW